MTTASSSACHGPASGSSGASNKVTCISSRAAVRRIQMCPLLADPYSCTLQPQLGRL
jgi:hypothetical protein